MCPGGTVVPAASNEGGIVTNGMSEYSRMGDNSNAAFLVSVTPADFPDDTATSGIKLQEQIEKAAYSLTSSYLAPSTTMEAFLKGENARIGALAPTYPIGTVAKSPNEYLPEYITASLKQAMSDFDDWMHGFYYPDATLTGPETRTTSPVRVLRDEKYEAPTLQGLFPSGEGAGYAGGIISSAIDGIKCAEAMLLKKQ